jgi:DNA-binding CsgD family transcriptional regulator
MELLEREGVLTALSDHFALASRGQGRLVLLGGEAGIGKTAVLDNLAGATFSVADVLVGYCDPLSTPRPLGPLIDMAAGLDARVRRELERASDGTGGISEVCRSVLESLGVGPPKVLIFEDVHWADEATLDLLCLLARRIDHLAVLVVASYRDDEIGPAHPLRVLLGHLAGVPAVYRCVVEPLTLAAVARIAAGRQFDVAELHRVTGGNPFFVTEVLAAGGDGIPATVAAVITGRLASVTPAARHTMEVVAVIGSPAPMPLIGALVEDAAGTVGELLGAGLLQPMGDGVGFRHELARMATLGTIPAYARARLHAHVLRTLHAEPGRREDTALLAHHADAAGDTDAVLEYAPLAAARAEALGAHREAAAHYRRALRCGASLPSDRRAALLEGLARASLLAGQLTDTVLALERAIRLRRDLGDRLQEGADLRWLSFVFWPLARCAEAHRTGEQAVRILEGLAPSRELAWACVNMCQLSAYGQDGIAITAAYADRAVVLAERFTDPEIEWQARFHLALARYSSVGDEALAGQACADMELARAATLDAGLIEAAAFMAMLTTIYAGIHRDSERVSSAIELLETHSRNRDILLYLTCGRGHRTLSLLHRGCWEQAAEVADTVLDHPSPPPIARMVPLVVLAMIRARRGDPEVWALLDEALSTFEPTGWTLLICAARAEAAWLSGDQPQARIEARRGLDAATAHTDPWITGELARWACLAGGQCPPVRAAPPFALELAGDWAGAATAWEQLGCPYDAGLARLGGDVPVLIKALTTFEILGARPAAAMARLRLRAQGASVGTRGPRTGTRANPYGLTARQLEILQLLREGLTGLHVATRLQISPKTTDNHISAILAKLNVRSRAEAITKLGE